MTSPLNPAGESAFPTQSPGGSSVRLGCAVNVPRPRNSRGTAVRIRFSGLGGGATPSCELGSPAGPARGGLRPGPERVRPPPRFSSENVGIWHRGHRCPDNRRRDEDGSPAMPGGILAGAGPYPAPSPLHHPQSGAARGGAGCSVSARRNRGGYALPGRLAVGVFQKVGGIFHSDWCRNRELARRSTSTRRSGGRPSGVRLHPWIVN